MSASPDDPSPSTAEPPLTGIRVLDISTIYAGPIAAMLLGDFGAEVVKVEHPKGDPARDHGPNRDGHGLWWKIISRNKRAVTLNLSCRKGQQIFLQLVASCDVVVENFRPGVLEKWGLGPDSLHQVNPGLVLLRVSGFGQTGPYAQRRGFGTLAEAMSGFAHQTGPSDGPPTLPAFGLADGVAGIAGAFAVLAALRHREQRGGRGQVVDLSLLEPLITILGPGPTAFDQLGVVPGRHGNTSPNNAPRNTYLTLDDRWVAVSSSATSVAERVMILVGMPEVVHEPWFASAGERSRRSDLLDSAVARWIRDRTYDEVEKAFVDAGAALAPIYDVAQLVADPHVQAREVFTDIDDEDLGRLKMQNLMVRLSQSPGRIKFAGRRLGQDTQQFYRDELGLGDAQLDALRDKGVL